MWCTNRLLWHTNSDFYGIRTLASTPYEPFLLGLGVVFNILIFGPWTRASRKSSHRCKPTIALLQPRLVPGQRFRASSPPKTKTWDHRGIPNNRSSQVHREVGANFGSEFLPKAVTFCEEMPDLGRLIFYHCRALGHSTSEISTGNHLPRKYRRIPQLLPVLVLKFL